MRFWCFVCALLFCCSSCTLIKGFKVSNSATYYVIDQHENCVKNAKLVYFSNDAMLVFANDPYLNLMNLNFNKLDHIKDTVLRRNISSLRIIRVDTVISMFNIREALPIYDKMPSYSYFVIDRLVLLVYAKNDKKLFETLNTIPSAGKLQRIIRREICKYNRNRTC